MKRFAIALLLPLGGCFGLKAPDPVIVVKNVETPVPNECLTADPDWRDPPKGFEPIEGTARRERTNKDDFKGMRSNRAVCRAGLKAQPQPTFRG